MLAALIFFFSFSSGGFFFRPIYGCSVQAGEIHQDVSRSAHQCINRAMFKEISEACSFEVAIVAETRHKGPGAFALSVECYGRFSPKYSGGVPVDDRADIVFVENSMQPFAVNI